MHVYVASAFANKEEVRFVQRELINNGHTISYDWTQDDASHLIPDSCQFYSFLEQCGSNDLRGILAAAAVIVIAHPEMRDTRTEMGIAIGAEIPCFILYSERTHSVFYRSTVRVQSIEELLGCLRVLQYVEDRL